MRMTMYLYSKALVCIIAVLFSIQSWSSPPRAERDLSGYTPVQIKLNSYAALPIEQEVKFFETMDAEADDQKIKTFYIIGGMRLKLSLSESIIGPVELNQQATYTWSIIENGAASNVACASLNITETCDLTLNTITGPELYWQPKDWSLGLNAVGTIKVSYPEASQYPEQTIKFKIANRVIGPAMIESEGSDIKMLEQMLWQLGLSPQKGQGYQGRSRAGEQGNRIFSKRSSSLGYTKNCDGSKASVRNIFSTGWDSCSNGLVALEGMVRRFKGRHISAEEGNKFARSGGSTVNGTVDENTLTDLKYAWSQYFTAVQNNPSTVITIDHASANNWLESAIKIWDEGLGSNVPITYTKNKHDKVLELAGVSGNQYSRKALLKSWKGREAKSHWGHGFPKTSYRMTEGGADELGSMSFNQIQYHYRYSKKPIRVHKEKALNYFDPGDNIKGFIIHTAANAGGNTTEGYGHKGAFYKVFAQGIARSHNNNTLKAYRNCDSLGVCSAINLIKPQEDEYEQLARGIAAYNSNPGDDSWPLIIKNKKPGSCRACEYTIDVRNSADKFNLPYRTYIWEGGIYPPFIFTENGELEMDASGVPKPHPKSGEKWCFKYGEKEWVDGIKYVDADKQSKNHASGYPKPDNIDYRSECGV
jgi:hypothetical protein